MELQGNLIETIINNDENFDLEDLRGIYLKNIGEANVTFGLLELKPNESTTFDSGNVTLKKKSVQIKFKTEVSDVKKLYVRATKVVSTICR